MRCPEELCASVSTFSVRIFAPTLDTLAELLPSGCVFLLVGSTHCVLVLGINRYPQWPENHPTLD